MPKVIVDHNGGVSGKDGRLHTFKAGEEIELPSEVIDALGDSATPRGGKTNDKKSDVNTPDENKVSYKDLQEQAKKLDLPVNGTYEALKASVDAKNAEIEAANKKADEKGGQIKETVAPVNGMVTKDATVTK